MKISLTVVLPDTLAPIVQSKPDILCGAIERAVRDYLRREISIGPRVILGGVFYDPYEDIPPKRRD